jgi:predicted RNA binding protein YcfA (HicA-like mRNA interferase family)
MTRLPALDARQVGRALGRAGLVIKRTSGSHQLFEHPDDPRRRTIVPYHGGKSLPRGTLRAIIAQAGLTVDEFLKLL